LIQSSTVTKPSIGPLEMSSTTEPVITPLSAMPQVGAYRSDSTVSLNTAASNAAAMNAPALNTWAREPNDFSAPVASNIPAKLTSAQSIAFHAPAARIENTPEKERLTWNVSKPTLQSNSVAKPIVSPWYVLSHSDNAPKTAKKFDWGSVTKLFQWHN
jgi:hypothetical protein